MQYGALCWRVKNGRRQILLITSRETGRWVIPKGWPMEDRTPAGAAAQEAWEEAGVRGDVASVPIGSFLYDKVMSRRKNAVVSLRTRVRVFALKVRALEKDYPERKQRRRRWVSCSKAARLVREPDLAALLRAFEDA
ncbi:NUDIX domain-containing protein [Falsirhodobacter algicola]|uniref:NUDIX domain-containing protein n=1 Tax=Falsirhodobacter algicola TaxID=2692330 RepID=A0A8J8SLV8_9RHOB|nr:NUDIX domain-containing protein [Falsirhodobacter algicola]